MSASHQMYLNALYLLLGDNSDRSRILVKEFTEIMEKPGMKKEILSEDDDLITVYRSLIKSIIQENISQENTTASKMLLLKLSTNEIIKNHPVQRDLLTDVLTAREKITAEQVDEYTKALRNAILSAEIDLNMRKVFAKSRSLMSIDDTELQTNEIANLKAMLDQSLKTIEGREREGQAKATESYVSMTDPTSIRRALDKYMERSVTGVIKSGLQGLNKSLGARGGVGLGESVVFAAPSHHYKSGMLVSWLLWTVAYNADVLKSVVPPGKRALVYFISLENEVHQNIMFVFKALYARVEKRHVNITEISLDEATQWIENYFKQFDIDLIIDRYNPHEFSYNKYVKLHDTFVDLGYHVVAFILDYLSEAKGIDAGDTMSAVGHQALIKENYIKFCNHGKQLGYGFFTGHQLNRKADEALAQFPSYAVKRFNPAMVADSSDVFRPVDIFYYMALQNNIDGQKFLTAINRKNRGNQDTPDAHKFFAYPFTEFGIEDDIGKLPGFVTDVDAWSGPQSSNAEVTTHALF